MKELSTLAQQVIAQTSAASTTGVPTRVLGRTNVRVPIIGIGGWHLGAINEDADAIRLMHAAIDEGVTFFDNAWDYQDGHAEEVMGKALAMDGRRDKVFLMTKNCNRDYAGSMQCLEDSLRRLQTDHLDLWQFHECNYDNDPDWIFETGGYEAALEARRTGKVRFIGFTGHKDPRIHLNMLAKTHDWDTSQMPINLLDTQYRSFLREVVPQCLERNIGIIGMKGLGGGWPDGRFLSSAGLTPEECYRFCLSLPVSVQVMGINTLAQLKQDIRIVREFVPMTAAEMENALSRLKTVAGDGRHELFKSTTDFDGPHHRIQHGFAVAAS